MDIQKEREAFEKHASKFFTTNEAFENDFLSCLSGSEPGLV